MSESPTLAIVRVPPPWYAAKPLIVNGFRKAVPEYAAAPGLQRKYFTIADDGRFGGVYLWPSRAVAERWFGPAWHARVTKRYGKDGQVDFLETPLGIKGAAAGKASTPDVVVALNEVPLPPGTPREAILKGFEASVPLYRSGPGLMAKDYVIDRRADGSLWIGGIYLWESRAAAKAFWNDAYMAKAKATYGRAPVQTFFSAPVLLDNRK